MRGHTRDLVLGAVALAVALPASAGNLVTNGDFSSGLEGWSQVVVATSWGGAPQFEVLHSDACLPDQRSWLGINAWAGADGYVEQSVALPCFGDITLSLRTWGNKDPTTATISVVDEEGAEHVLDRYVPPPIHAEPSPGQVVCSGSAPISKQFDLSAYAGQTLRLRLRGSSSGISGTYADFDDVEIRASAEARVEITEAPARLQIPQHDGVAEVRLDPPAATLFGRTVLPFRARLTRASGEPIARCSVTARVGAPTISGLGEDPSGAGAAELRVSTDADGRTPQLYLVGRDLFEAQPTPASLTVTVSYGDTEATHAFGVVNNLEALAELYRARIPTGAWRDWLEQLVTPPVSDSAGLFFRLVFADINTWRGCYVCSDYQSQVLALFNGLRHGADTAWIMNGLDYGPIQNVTIGMFWLHFATIVYPADKPWAFPGEWTLIFDPWPAQKPLVFTPDTWQRLLGPYRADATTYGPQPDLPNYVPDYPMYTPHDPYPESGTGRGSLASHGCAVKTLVVAESPVALGFTRSDGARIGYHAGAWVSEVPDPATYVALGVPEPGSRTAQLLFLPEDEGTLTVTGTAAGTFGLHVGYPLEGGGWSWSSYLDVPVAVGEAIAVPLSSAEPCQPGARIGGGSVAAEAECPRLVTAAPAERESSCACRSTGLGAPPWAWVIAAAALAAARRGLPSERRARATLR